MVRDNRTIDQILEVSDFKIAKYRIPRNIKSMQIKFNEAVFALASLFDIKDEELKNIVLPEFDFCDIENRYLPNINEVWMEPEGITSYRIGYVAGEFLYYIINPQIFCKRDEFLLAHIRSICQSDELSPNKQYRCLGNAYLTLTTFVKHYCGLLWGKDCYLESDDLPKHLDILYSLPEDSFIDYLNKMGAIANCKGRIIARDLINHYPTEKFKSIVSLRFKDAMISLFSITDVKLLEMDI